MLLLEPTLHKSYADRPGKADTLFSRPYRWVEYGRTAKGARMLVQLRAQALGLGGDHEMRVIETEGTVTPGGELTVRVRLPEGAPPGPRRVVVVVEDVAAPRPPQTLKLPVLQVASWPADLPLRREEIYGDGGR